MTIPPFINFITSPALQRQLFVPKIVFIVFTAFFTGFLLFFIFRTKYFNDLFLRDFAEFFSQRVFLVSKLARQWEKIKKRLDSGTEAEYKLALIEADSLLDDILERMGYKGETLDERLKEVPKTFLSNIDEVEKAHQVRNDSVHNPDYHLTDDQAKEAMEIYEKALRDIEAL
jgi:hypothetical protein